MGYFKQLEIALKDKQNYSWTFTIPSFKNVKYKSANVTYGKLSNAQQYDLLENHLQNITFGKFDTIYWVYEQHKESDNRLHVHGFIEQVNEEQVEQFRNDFYSSYRINCSYKSYIKFSDIQRTLVDKRYFQDYMKKHQNEITYFMSVIEDKKHSEAIDKGIKIEVNNISPKYLNTLEEHLESRELGDEYPFGKMNKFLVEI